MTAKKTTAAKTAAPKKAAAKKAPAKAPAKTKATSAGPKSKSGIDKTAQQKPARLSALDAAAQVLARSKEPLNCRQLIQIMAERGLWKSPAGASPDRTVYSAMLREIATKGKDSRFVRVERGRFAHKA